MSRGSIAIVMLLVSGPELGTAWADDIQVNTYTTNIQRNPKVAMDADGDFVVVWQSIGSYGSDSYFWSIQAQRFDADGSAAGGQFQVNTYTTDSQRYSGVAMDADGDFVVVWRSRGSSGSDTDGHSIQGQRFARDGSAMGDEFQVNTNTTDNQSSAAVAMDPDGGFVVVWDDQRGAGPGTFDNIQGQRYAADGSAVGGQFEVNTYFTGRQEHPDIAMDPDGNFVVVWSTYNVNGRVHARRYAADGSAVGGEFQVNTLSDGMLCDAAVAMNNNGDFVVVWQTYGLYYGGSYIESLQGQRFAADGSPIGGEMVIADTGSDITGYASVAMNAVGDFIVVWNGTESGGEDLHGIEGRRYASDGSAIGDRFEVNTYTTGFQSNVSVAMDDAARVIVAWTSPESSGTDSDLHSVQRTPVEVLFVDGFESGDTSAWIKESD